MPIEMRPGRQDVSVCLLLIAAVLGVYWQMWDHDFINLDDHLYVTDNSFVLRGLTPGGLIWALTNTNQAGLWIPLTWLSLMLDYDLYGLTAGGYKITNLLFHLANTLLLFMALKKMTGKRWQSGFVAALFALHPLHVESVAWVTERKDVLSTFFWMLSIWFYLRYVERPGLKRYLPVLLSFALGLMAKPMVVTLPFVLLLLDYWPLNRFRQPPGNVGDNLSCRFPAVLKRGITPGVNLLLEKLPLLLLAVAVSVVTIFAQHNRGAAASLESLSVMGRIANSLVSYVSYIGKMIWPLSLGVMYPHPVNRLPVWQAAGAGLIMGVISFLVIRELRRHPYLMVGWLWYLVTLLPMIGLVQVGPQAMADRFTYVPLIGLFIMLAWGGADLLSGWRHRGEVLSFFAITIILGLMSLSWFQVSLWENGCKLYEHNLRVAGNDPLIQNNLGLTLMEKGRYDESVRCFSEALRLAPGYELANNNLGFVLDIQGKTRESVFYFSEALKTNPDNAQAHNNLGRALAQLGSNKEAIQQFSEAIRVKPDYAEAHNNLGHALADQGNIPEAVQHFVEALRIIPDFAEAHNNLGVVLVKQGKLREAVGHFSEALRLEPDYAEAYRNLQVALAQQGRL